MSGKVITVLSGKGGAGKTVIAVNMGVTLAMSGRSVLLLDLNPGFRSMDFCVQMQDEIVYDVEDVLNGICRISQAVIPVTGFNQLNIMSCSQIPNKANFDSKKMNTLFDILSNSFEYIIIDTPSGLCRLTKEALSNSDYALIVTTAEYASVRASNTILSEIKKSGVKDKSLIINRIKLEQMNSEHCPTITEISGSLKVRLVGMIQEDESIYTSYNNGVPIVSQRKSYISENFVNIMNRMNL